MFSLYQVITGLEEGVSWIIRYFQDNPGQLIGVVVSIIATFTLFWRLNRRLRKYKGGIIEAVRDALKSKRDKRKGKGKKVAKEYSILLVGIGASGKTSTVDMLIQALSLRDVNGVKEVTSSEDRVMDGKTPPDDVLVRTLEFDKRIGKEKIRLHFLDAAGELLEPLSGRKGSTQNRSYRIRKLLNSVDLCLCTVKMSKDLKKQRLLMERLFSQESKEPIQIRAHFIETFLDKVSVKKPSDYLRERWASLIQSLQNSNEVKIIPTNPALFKKYQKSSRVSVKDKIEDLNVDQIIDTLLEELGLKRGDGL